MAPPTYSPTLKPTSSCTGSTPGWVDSSGDGCEWYESVDMPGCPRYGQMYDGGMGVANVYCCYCEGTGVSHNSENLKDTFYCTHYILTSCLI